MTEFLQVAWPFIVLALLVLTKLNRHLETAKKNQAEKAVWNAEEILVRGMTAIGRSLKDPEQRDKALNDIAGEISPDNDYKRALVDGVIHVLEQEGKEGRKITPIPGISHPLDQLAANAVTAETKVEKRNRFLKKAAVTVLNIVKGML